MQTTKASLSCNRGPAIFRHVRRAKPMLVVQETARVNTTEPLSLINVIHASRLHICDSSSNRLPMLFTLPTKVHPGRVEMAKKRPELSSAPRYSLSRFLQDAPWRISPESILHTWSRLWRG